MDGSRPRARIALIGDHDPAVVAHRAIPLALALATDPSGDPVDAVWVHTSTLVGDVTAPLEMFDGIWCVPGSPYANTHGALAAIRMAREQHRPYLGTCGGFQHALFEYAALVRADFRRYLADLEDQRAADVVTFTVASGTAQMTRRKLAIHIVLHEIRHLAQAALAARLAGHEPPGQHDLFYFPEFP